MSGATTTAVPVEKSSESDQGGPTSDADVVRAQPDLPHRNIIVEAKSIPGHIPGELGIPRDLEAKFRGYSEQHHGLTPGAEIATYARIQEDEDPKTRGQFFDVAAGELPDAKAVSVALEVFEDMKVVVPDLLELEDMQRLDGVRQMTASFTERGSTINHSRLLHSLDVMRRTVMLACQCHVRNPDSIRREDIPPLAYGGLLHDVGHTPLSHTGEHVLQQLGPRVAERLGLAGDFNHEQHGWELIRSGPIGRVLEGWGVDVGRIIEALSDNRDTQIGKLSALIDFADRASYLIRDVLSSRTDSRIKREITMRVRKLNDSVFVNKGDVYLEKWQTGSAVISARNFLFTHYSQHPATLLANEVLTRGLLDVFNRSEAPLDVLRFLHMQDDNVIEQMDERTQGWLGRARENGEPAGGLEHRFEVVDAWEVSKLNNDGATLAHARNFQRLAHESASLRAIVDPRELFVPPAVDTSKTITFYELGDDGVDNDHTINQVIAQDSQFVVFAVPTDAGIDIGRVRPGVNDFMRPFLKDRTPTQVNVFGDLDPALQGPLRHKEALRLVG